MKSPDGKYRSLRTKLLVPLALLGLVLAITGTWLIHHFFSSRIFEQAQRRALALTHVVDYAAGSGVELPQLQRFVSALGAEPDVALVVVCGGQPSRVIACSRHAWRDQPVDQLPDEDLGGALTQAGQTRREHTRLDPDRVEFNLTVPLLAAASNDPEGHFARGAVGLLLDAAPIRQQAAHLAWLTSGVLLGTILLFTAVAYGFISRLVIRPAAAITAAVNRRGQGDPDTVAPVLGRDEIGTLAETLNDTLDQLSCSEQRFRVMYDAIPSMYFTVSSQLTVLSVNRYGAGQLGYSPRDLTGRCVLDVFHEDDRDAVREAIGACLKKPHIVGGWEFRKVHRDGHTMWVKETARVSDTGDGRPVVLIVCEDITTRRQDQQALREKTQRLELMNLLTAAVNAQTPIPQLLDETLARVHEYFSDYRVCYGTIGSEGMLSITRSYQPSSMPSITGTEADLTVAPAYLDALIRREAVVVEDVDHDDRLARIAETLRSSGARAVMDVPLTHSDQLVGLICFDAPTPHAWTNHEFTTLRAVAEFLRIAIQEANVRHQQRVAEKALQENEKRLLQAQRVARLGFWDWEIVTDNLYWSDEIYRIFGVDPDQFGASYDAFLEAVHPEDRRFVQQRVDDAVQCDSAYSIDHRVVRPDGQVRYVHEDGVVMRGPQGRPKRMIGTVVDITERKEAELALAESERFARSTIDALRGHLAILDEHGTILAVNQAWRDFGAERCLNQQQLCEGASYLAVCDQTVGDCSKEAGLIAAGIRSVIAGQKPEFSLEYSCHSPGEERWCIARVTRFQGDGPVRVVIVHDDITELKRAEESLHRKNTDVQLLQSIAVAANEAADVDEAMQTALDEVCRSTGWPIGHVYFSDDTGPGLSPATIWHLDDPRRFEPLRRVTERSQLAAGIGLPGRVLASGRPAWIIDVTRDMNFPRARSADDLGVRAGFAFPVLIGSDVAAVLEFFAEDPIDPDPQLLETVTYLGTMLGRVIERKRSEEALRRSQERFDLAVAGSQDGLWDWDIAGGQVWYSPRWKEQLGYEDHELPNEYEAWESRLHPEDKPGILEALQRHFEHDAPYDVEFRMMAQDGRYRWIHARGVAVRDQAGKPVRMAGSHRDVTKRKKIEQDLRESEERYKTLFDYAGVGIAHLDQDHRFLRVNPQICRFLGYSGSELEGMSVRDITHRDDWGVSHERMRALASGETRAITLEKRYIHKDGAVKWGKVTSAVIDPPQGRFHVAVVEDITDRKERDDQLAAMMKREQSARADAEASHQKIVDIIERISDGFVALDRDWRYTYVNQKAAELINRKPGDLIGKHIWTEFPEGAAQPFRGAYEKAVADQEVVHFEDYYAPWGRWFYNRIYPSPNGLSIFFQDVTERKKQEENLRQTNRFLDSLIETIPHMIFVKDVNELRFVRFNRAGEQLVGYPREDLIGKNDFDFFPLDEAEFFTRQDRQVLQGKALIEIPEETIHTRNQGTRLLRTLKVPILDDHGTPKYLLGISEDITEKKQTQVQLAQTVTELEHKNRDLEQFIFAASHDLQSPLVTILGYTGHIKKKLQRGDTTELEDMFLRVNRAAIRMKRSITDLLDYSRIGRVRFDPQRVDTATLLGEIHENLSDRFASQQAVFEVQPGPPTVTADRNRLWQLFENLVLNALKYGCAKPRSRIQAGGHVDGGEVLLFVRDHGTGIHPKYHDKIFDLFQRLDTNRDGTGVGLAIVRRIAEAHGGRAWVESQPGEGATFWVAFPDGRSSA